MIVVPLKEGENIEKALKKFKRKGACHVKKTWQEKSVFSHRLLGFNLKHLARSH